MAQTQAGSYIQVSNYLKNTLIPSITTIRTSNIYDYEPTDLGGFPAVTITVSSEANKTLDNVRNETIYHFYIRYFIERKNLTSNNAESILRTVADEMRLKVQADVSLGGNCLYAGYSVKYGYVDRENNDIRLAEIDLEVHDAVTWR